MALELSENELIMLDALAYFTRRIMYVGTANINKNDVATHITKLIKKTLDKLPHLCYNIIAMRIWRNWQTRMVRIAL